MLSNFKDSRMILKNQKFIGVYEYFFYRSAQKTHMLKASPIEN